MEKYFKRKSTIEQPSSPHASSPLDEARNRTMGPPMKKRFLEFDLEKLHNDPGLRPSISDYHPSDRDEIRRYYLQKGPCQPKEINFPQTKFGNHLRRFNPEWYSKYGNWLEYSQKEDAAFCLCCYIMRSDVGQHKGCGETFITEGFRNWKKLDRFEIHVGGPSSSHNQAYRNCQALVIDRQLQELNNRFTETNTELLLCVACLNPKDSFAVFNKEKLIRLAQFYPLDFSPVEILALDNQLENYFADVCSDSAFLELGGITDLSIKLVETKKHVVYPLVYLLLELALILPVATATVERAFSAMNIIKNRMRNSMGDEWLNDCLITYVEKDIFDSVDNEKIIQCFQNMKTRREQL